MLIDLGIVRKVMAYDLAEDLVCKANAEFRQFGYDIEYLVGDLNFIHFEPAQYEVCLAMHSLHHIVALESLIPEIARSLDPQSGVLVSLDYVGPRYVELPATAQRIVSGIFEKIPEHFRRSVDGRSVIRHPSFPDRWAVLHDSPFEALRSDRILNVLNGSFEFEICNNLGGGLLSPLLNPIIHNFNPADAEANALLAGLMEEDLELTKKKLIPNNLVFLVARPRV